MSAISRISQASVRVRWPGWGVVFVGLASLWLACLVLSPWSVEATSIAVLHGLCAQRPSHSFWFGAERLPFGSRMTGIYGGFFVTQLYLLLRGRFRAGGVPSLGVLSTLLVFVVLMGLDGLNSTLADVRLVTVYSPTNVLRYATGALTGTTLAVFLWLLTSNILWSADVQRPAKVISGFGELALIALPVAGFGLLAMSGWALLYPFVALVLVVSAVLVIFQLAICFVLLSRHEENRARSSADLSRVAVWSLLAAFLFMMAIVRRAIRAGGDTACPAAAITFKFCRRQAHR